MYMYIYIYIYVCIYCKVFIFAGLNFRLFAATDVFTGLNFREIITSSKPTFECVFYSPCLNYRRFKLLANIAKIKAERKNLLFSI